MTSLQIKEEDVPPLAGKTALVTGILRYPPPNDYSHLESKVVHQASAWQ